MKILRSIAKRLGFSNIVGDRGLTVIPIGGFSRWPTVEAFAWIKSELLGSSVEVRLILDRDYRSLPECQTLEADMNARGVNVHVWRKKELESYLLIPSLVSRLSGASPSDAEEWMNSVADSLEGGVEAQFIKLAIQTKPKAEDIATVAQRSIGEFKSMWQDLHAKLAMCPAKDVISGLNSKLQAENCETVTARSLASNVRVSELDAEMMAVLSDIEYTLGQPG